MRVQFCILGSLLDCQAVEHFVPHVSYSEGVQTVPPVSVLRACRVLVRAPDAAWLTYVKQGAVSVWERPGCVLIWGLSVLEASAVPLGAQDIASTRDASAQVIPDSQ